MQTKTVKLVNKNKIKAIKPVLFIGSANIRLKGDSGAEVANNFIESFGHRYKECDKVISDKKAITKRHRDILH
jgi:hypothetical protein